MHRFHCLKFNPTVMKLYDRFNAKSPDDGGGKLRSFVYIFIIVLTILFIVALIKWIS